MDLIKGQDFTTSISRCSKHSICYQDCNFANIVLNDVELVNVKFVKCKFDRVIVESSSFERIDVIDSKILSLSIRGNRKISKKIFLQKKKTGYIKKVDFSQGNEIDELSLCGNLLIEECSFPEGQNYVHLNNPFYIYRKVSDFISNNWTGEKQRLGLTEINTFYLSKQVESQNEDFVTYLYNDYLDKNVNDIIFEVFALVRKFSVEAESNTDDQD